MNEPNRSQNSILTALIPLSADSPTIGHADLLKSACQIFPKVYWSIGINPDKNYLFSSAQRQEMLQCYVDYLELNDQVIITDYQGSTVQYADSIGVSIMLKGVRNSIDFQYELDQASANQRINPKVSTLFLPTKPELSFISSSLVRRHIALKLSFDEYVITSIQDHIKKWLSSNE
ncbi:MAG: pantetheine-phosphate adenylyltransferase [Pseudomonadota bacterium]